MLITDWTPDAIKDSHRDKFIFDFSDDPCKLQEMPLYAAYYLLGCLLFSARHYLIRHLNDKVRTGDIDPRFLTNILCFLLAVKLAEHDGRLVPNQFDDAELICEFSAFNREFTLSYRIGIFNHSTVEINDMDWQDHAPEFRLLAVSALIKSIAEGNIKIAPIRDPNVDGLTNG
jgi:hypothetical protein